MRIAGFILIILGVVGLVYGSITYRRSEETMSVGPISATVKQRESLPIPPAVAAVVLAVGIALLVADKRRRA
jgi:uncharacterized membrane protein YidH (DUF202 family)